MREKIKLRSLYSPAGSAARRQHYGRRISCHGDQFVVKDNVEQGVVDLQFTVVVDEPQLAELPHENADS